MLTLFMLDLVQNIVEGSKVMKAFGHLHRFCQYHMGVHNYADGDEERRQQDILQAREEGLAFGRLAEKVGAFCTSSSWPPH